MAKKPAKKTASKAKPAKKSAAKKPAAKKAAPARTAAPTKASLPPHILKDKKAAGLLKPKNGKAYTLSEVIENIRGASGIAKRSDAKELCENIASFLADALKKGYKIPLLGLGKLYVRETKARKARNPMTGAEVNVPARKRVRFTVAKSLKDSITK